MRYPYISAFALLAVLACGDGPSDPAGGSGGTGGTSGPSSSSGGNTATQSVGIRDFAFSPSTVTVAVGTEVRWTNDGPSLHTTTSDAGLWSSGNLSGGSGGGYGSGSSGSRSFAMTFAQAGTFEYHCSNHPNMTARVVVGSQ